LQKGAEGRACAIGAACAWEAKTASDSAKKFVCIGAACVKKNSF